MRGFGDIAERLRRSTVQIFNGSDQSRGSGIVWNDGGLILTNAHVARAPEAEIELWDGRRFHARVASRDRRRDLATLRMTLTDGDAPGLEPATAGGFDGTTPRRTRDCDRQPDGIRRRAFDGCGALDGAIARTGTPELDSRRCPAGARATPGVRWPTRRAG